MVIALTRAFPRMARALKEASQRAAPKSTLVTKKPIETFALPGAAIVHEHQHGRPHVQVQERLTGHLIVGRHQGYVLTRRVNVAQAALEPAAYIRRNRAAGGVHQFGGLFGSCRGVRRGQLQHRTLDH